jgi:hypothetical protein
MILKYPGVSPVTIAEDVMLALIESAGENPISISPELLS